MALPHDETYQRRIDTMEWTPNAMTEEERLERRRFEAYFAFETQNWHSALSREQFGSPSAS
jgi:hypothetical protein